MFDKWLDRLAGKDFANDGPARAVSASTLATRDYQLQVLCLSTSVTKAFRSTPSRPWPPGLTVERTSTRAYASTNARNNK